MKKYDLGGPLDTLPIPKKKYKFPASYTGDQSPLTNANGAALMEAPTSMNFSTLKNLDGTSFQPASKTKQPGAFSRILSKVSTDKINAGVNGVAPYISNIANSWRKPPMPAKTTPYSFTNLTKVNYSAERDAVNRKYGAADKAAERNVDNNTAEAVKAYNRGQQEHEISNVNDRENQDNIRINNAQAGMDLQIKAMNTGLLNDVEHQKVQRNIANQREQSANLANAGDKFTLIGNEKRKAAVDIQKTKVLSSAFNTSGVYQRKRAQWKAAGVEDPLGMDYADLEDDDKKKKSNGGFMNHLIKLN